MKIFKEDLAAANIPLSALRTEFFDGKQNIVIRNPIYCNIFWVWMWRNKYLKMYINQEIIGPIDVIDLNSAIMIDATTNELLTQTPTARNIEYYGSNNFILPSPFEFKWATNFSFFWFVLLVSTIAVLWVWVTLKKNITVDLNQI